MAATMMKALLNTLMGMGTVFLVLIFISLLISLFKYIPGFLTRMEGRRQSKKKKQQKVASSGRPAPSRPILEEEEEEPEDEELIYDGQLVAVITAAILASAGGAVSADKLVVRSIRRVKTKNRR